MTLGEEPNLDRLQESLKLFSSVCNNVFFRDTPRISFLNKFELFQRKILHSGRHLHLYLPLFTGETLRPYQLLFTGETRRLYLPLFTGETRRLYLPLFTGETGSSTCRGSQPPVTERPPGSTPAGTMRSLPRLVSQSRTPPPLF
ncbi:unnamed protein product [Gadus morhua 'NCC']